LKPAAIKIGTISARPLFAYVRIDAASRTRKIEKALRLREAKKAAKA
jgi:hypothetical protein